MFVNCSLMGMDFGMPDVCLTPPPPPFGPIPIPYPNMGMKPLGLPPNPRHLIMCMPSHNMATTVPLTMGDFGGVFGGVMSGMFMGPSRNLLGSFKLISGGMPATTMLKMSMQNLTNCPPGMTLVPSQPRLIALV
jgi:hypothetical protein